MTASTNITKALPSILAFAGTIGVVGTAVLAAHGHLKAQDVLNDISFEEDTEFVERAEVIVKNTWKDYAPAVVCGIFTVACILGSNHAHLKTEAALVALTGVIGSRLKGMNKAVLQEFGKEKLEEIRGRIISEEVKENKDKYKKIAKKKDRSDGDVYYEPFTEQYFWATEEEILRAETELNKMFQKDGSVTLFQFLEMLPGNLDVPTWADDMGWYMGDGSFDIEGSFYGYYISINPTPTEVEGDHQCNMLNYTVCPAEPSLEWQEAMNKSWDFQRALHAA